MSGLVRCKQEFLLLRNVQKCLSKGCASTTASSPQPDATTLSSPQPDATTLPVLHRTDETLARNHTVKDLGKFFTVDPKIISAFGPELNPKTNPKVINYFAPRLWSNRNEVFRESCIMIRNPALEIINCIKETDFEQPVVRYVLHGLEGNGKRLSIAHLKCFAFQENFVVMPFPTLKHWLTKYYEVAPSTYKPGRIDHVVNSNIFLKNFKQINADRLDKCVTHHDYSWSARDKFKAGTSLMEIIDLGCERLNFAADALNVLIKELKLNCNAGNCKLLVTIEGVNTLFTEYTMIHKLKSSWEPGPYPEDGDWMRNRAKVEECSVLVNILKLLNTDYKNAVLVTTVDRQAEVMKRLPATKWYTHQERNMVPNTKSHLPFALLGDKGWSTLNPFYPVAVDKYSEDEMDSAVDYYLETGWIRPECTQHNRRQELHFITARRPEDFFNFSSMY